MTEERYKYAVGRQWCVTCKNYDKPIHQHPCVNCRRTEKLKKSQLQSRNIRERKGKEVIV